MESVVGHEALAHSLCELGGNVRLGASVSTDEENGVSCQKGRQQ